MFDRHRSLIHMLLSGLVGLTLGLFIGWWVWPVEWTDVPAARPDVLPAVEWSDVPTPTTQPVPTTPPQRNEAQPPAGEQPASHYTAFLDRMNRGLLFLAAALLLGGGVVIGYQLVRQSQERRARKRAAASTAEEEAKPGAAMQARRPDTTPLAASAARPRPANLSWLHRKRPARYDDLDEPVFTPRPIDQLRPAAPPPFARPRESDAAIAGASAAAGQTVADPNIADPSIADPETETAAASRSAGRAETQTPNEALDDLPELAEDSDTDDSGIDNSDIDNSDIDNSDTDGEIAAQEGAPQVEERQTVPATETSANAARTEMSEDENESEDAAAGQTMPAPPTEEEEEEADSAGESADRATRRDPPQAIPAEESSQQSSPQSSQVEVGAFEANYAFGIQSYDESFTISAADGALLGACGIGINESLDRAAADADEVRLLDIWLYDRAAARSVSQPIVSPGFDATGLDARADSEGSETAAPLEAQPGLTCMLRSSRLLLACTIQSATFLDRGPRPRPFRSARVSLVARRLA